MLIGKSLFFKGYITQNNIRKFHVICKKPRSMIGYMCCSKCKIKELDSMIHLYNIGLENLHFNNLFICENCFESLEGPAHKLKDYCSEQIPQEGSVNSSGKSIK